MSAAINSSPAFPSPGVVLPNGRQQGAYEGMSLRDYFAAKAMQALMGSVDWPNVKPNSDKEAKAALESISALAFIQADTMLAARLGDAA